jgi:hypothetical protein
MTQEGGIASVTPARSEGIRMSLQHTAKALLRSKQPIKRPSSKKNIIASDVASLVSANNVVVRRYYDHCAMEMFTPRQRGSRVPVLSPNVLVPPK